MQRTFISELINNIGKTIKIAGWVQTKRDHGKLIFIDVWDFSGLLQAVGDQQFSNLRPQDALEIIGIVRERPAKDINEKTPNGRIELEIKEMKILSKAEELPFDMGQKDLNLELPTLLDWRGLTLRHAKVRAILKVQETVIEAFRQALKQKGFTEFQAPSIIPEAPEGGTEVFKIDYFGYQAFLAQSPQLYKQIMVGAFERVFAVNKVFRAEPSVTTRHLTEVVSLDAEFGFIDSWLDIVEMAEYTIKFILEAVARECARELELWQADLPKIEGKIPLVKLREAQEIIFKRTGVNHCQEKDLTPDDEREICKWSVEEKGSELVFVSHYPTKARPFYTYPDPENPEFNQGVDLIGRGFEWMTGGRRIENYQTLMTHAKEWGVDPKKIELYLQAFRFGMPPEGGFAFGAERITMGILGLKNVREAVPFPRDMERIDQRLSVLRPKTNKKNERS